ncbi:unnamed protein product [Mortierella alpina]
MPPDAHRHRRLGAEGLGGYDFGFSDDQNDEDAISVETIVNQAAIARFSQTPTPGKIKSLQLPVVPERSNNPLTLPLLKSGQLDRESCTVFSFAEDSQPKDVEHTVQKFCPSLKHLRCPRYYSVEDSKVACAFIRGCSGLQSFAADRHCEDFNTVDINSSKTRDIILTLASHHCGILEDFELERM